MLAASVKQSRKGESKCNCCTGGSVDSLEKGPDVGEIAEVPDGQVRGVAQGKSHGTRERESISSGMRCAERRGDGGLGEQTKSNKNNYDVNARCLGAYSPYGPRSSC